LAQAQSSHEGKFLRLTLREKNLRAGTSNSNFESKKYFSRCRIYERFVKVFNNSVENFVEKPLQFSKTSAN